MKKKFILVLIIFWIVPCIAWSQYYIIEDVPNLGDDGLSPKEDIDVRSINNSQEIIDDVTTKTTVTKTVTTTIKKTVKENKITFELGGLIGAITGSTLLLAGAGIPLFATTPTMFQDMLLLNLFGVFVKRKNQQRWGTVFDIDTKRPIPATKIVLFDEKMRELETTYSDKDGRFGFLAREGKYKIDAYKKNYKAFVDKVQDEIYGNLYRGDIIEIKGDEVLHVNLAMKNQTVNWKEYANKKIAEYMSTWSYVKKYLFTTLYFIGFMATVIITFYYPSVFNIILLVINLIFFVAIFLFKRKDHGTVKSKGDKPVPFAVLNLYDDNGKKDAFAVTDVIGRYYMLADNGRYALKVSGQPTGEVKKEFQDNVRVRDGMVSKEIVLD